MNQNLRYEEKKCDLCVIGGGLAGSFAALAAARHGAKVRTARCSVETHPLRYVCG